MTKDQQITQLREALAQMVVLCEDYRRRLTNLGYTIFHQPPELTKSQFTLRETTPKPRKRGT